MLIGQRYRGDNVNSAFKLGNQLDGSDLEGVGHEACLLSLLRMALVNVIL